MNEVVELLKLLADTIKCEMKLNLIYKPKLKILIAKRKKYLINIIKKTYKFFEKDQHCEYCYVKNLNNLDEKDFKEMRKYIDKHSLDISIYGIINNSANEKINEIIIKKIIK